MTSNRPSQQPTVLMPRAEIDDPLGELPTNPLPPALLAVAEPLVTYDRDRSTWVLALPYEAEQMDAHGNTFLVHCSPELAVHLGRPVELRADVVAAQLRKSMAAALVIPFTGDSDGFAVTSVWRDIIVAAFRDADLGRLRRG